MNQLNLFSTAKNSNGAIAENYLHFVNNGEYLYLPHFFSKIESDAFLSALCNGIEWKQEGMKMYGKDLKFPRLTAWYGDNNKPYSFSGITLNPNKWTKEILDVKERIEPISNVIFNSVLLNLYRNGMDSISWHQDNEKELGTNPVIASVSFGVARVFQLRHKNTNEKIDITLQHGSLLIMKGEMQHFWQHQLPKTKMEIGTRVNLTFRVIK